MTKHLIQVFFSLILFTSTSMCLAEVPLSTALNGKISVTGQMTTEKFKALMQQGFKSVIVNRPDHEQGNLTSANELRGIAEKSRISLIYQPVSSDQISETDVQEFAKYYNSLPKPILLVCKSGNRSTILFNQAKSAGLLYE